jgi:hypothetical protein
LDAGIKYSSKRQSEFLTQIVFNNNRKAKEPQLEVYKHISYPFYDLIEF